MIEVQVNKGDINKLLAKFAKIKNFTKMKPIKYLVIQHHKYQNELNQMRLIKPGFYHQALITEKIKKIKTCLLGPKQNMLLI